jgi:hypothetical protein
MVKPVEICICETQFVTAKDKIYVEYNAEDNSEGLHIDQ